MDVSDTFYLNLFGILIQSSVPIVMLSLDDVESVGKRLIGYEVGDDEIPSVAIICF